MKSNEKSREEKHFICSRTWEAPGETLGAVNRMRRGCFSTDPDGVAGSSLDLQQERANTKTEKHHIGLVDAQASITPSATSPTLAN